MPHLLRRTALRALSSLPPLRRLRKVHAGPHCSWSWAAHVSTLPRESDRGHGPRTTARRRRGRRGSSASRETENVRERRERHWRRPHSRLFPCRGELCRGARAPARVDGRVARRQRLGIIARQPSAAIAAHLDGGARARAAVEHPNARRTRWPQRRRGALGTRTRLRVGTLLAEVDSRRAASA